MFWNKRIEKLEERIRSLEIIVSDLRYKFEKLDSETKFEIKPEGLSKIDPHPYFIAPLPKVSIRDLVGMLVQHLGLTVVYEEAKAPKVTIESVEVLENG